MARKRKEDGLYRRKDSPYLWASYIDANGRRVRCSTGTTEPNQAEAILAKWKLDVHRERMFGHEPERSFDELMVLYLRSTQAAKRSAERDLYITANLREFFGCRVMNELTGKDIYGYTTWRREAHLRGEPDSTHDDKSKRRKKKPIADSTIRRELSLLSAAISYAQKHFDWKLPNPVKNRKPAHGNNRIRWLRQEEATRLIEAAARDPRARPHLPDFIELGLHTGCRSQEMLGMEWSRVDLYQRLLYFPAENNKSKRDVSVPLNESAYRVLQRRAAFRDEHCPETPWVFCTKGGERIASVKKSFKTACQRACIEDFHPHDLRHTCATWLVQAGVPLVQVRDLLRHTTIQVTEKYAHLAPQNVRDAVDVLDDIYRNTSISGEPSPTHAYLQIPQGDESRSGHVRKHLRIISGGRANKKESETGE